MSQLSAYGVNLTPPNPVMNAMPTNPGSISSVITAANSAQNQANVANNTRYQQMLQLLGQGANYNNQAQNQAITSLGTNYNSAIGSLGNSLANNQTVFNTANAQTALDAQKAAANAQQSGVSRGLGNTTIADTMQNQVQQSKNLSDTQNAAAKASQDNAVYQNIANIYQNQGNATSAAVSRAGQDYASGAGTIANAVGARNDVAPDLSQYASLINAASRAGQFAPTTTKTQNGGINGPNTAFNSAGGGPSGSNMPGAGGSTGISGGIGASMGQGGFNSGGAGATLQGGGTNNNGPGSPTYYGDISSGMAPATSGTPSSLPPVAGNSAPAASVNSAAGVGPIEDNMGAAASQSAASNAAGTGGIYQAANGTWWRKTPSGDVQIG